MYVQIMITHLHVRVGRVRTSARPVPEESDSIAFTVFHGLSCDGMILILCQFHCTCPQQHPQMCTCMYVRVYTHSTSREKNMYVKWLTPRSLITMYIYRYTVTFLFLKCLAVGSSVPVHLHNLHKEVVDSVLLSVTISVNQEPESFGRIKLGAEGGDISVPSIV